MMIWFVVLFFNLIADYFAVVSNWPTPSGAYFIFHSARWFANPHMLLKLQITLSPTVCQLNFTRLISWAYWAACMLTDCTKHTYRTWSHTVIIEPWLVNPVFNKKCLKEWHHSYGLRKITRSAEVPNHEILGALHLRLYENIEFFQSPKA